MSCGGIAGAVIACDVSVLDTYFATAGTNMAAIEVRGEWGGLFVESVRCEIDGTGPMDHYISLVNGEMANTILSNFFIHGFGDTDELGFPVIAGDG